MSALALLASGALALTPIQAGGAAASGDPVLDDLACFVVMGDTPEGLSPEEQNSFMVIAIYFAGKLFGRDPGFDMAAAERRYSSQIERLDYGAQLERCLNEFTVMGQKLEAAGQQR